MHVLLKADDSYLSPAGIWRCTAFFSSVRPRPPQLLHHCVVELPDPPQDGQVAELQPASEQLRFFPWIQSAHGLTCRTGILPAVIDIW